VKWSPDNISAYYVAQCLVCRNAQTVLHTTPWETRLIEHKSRLLLETLSHGTITAP